MQAFVNLQAKGVLSTVPMNSGNATALSVGGAGFPAYATTGSPQTTATAALADMGLGLALDAALAGKVCLIKRGEVSFAVKVVNCQNSGGVGAVLWNNAPEAFGATLGGLVTNIASATVSGVDGALLMGRLPELQRRTDPRRAAQERARPGRGRARRQAWLRAGAGKSGV